MTTTENTTCGVCRKRPVDGLDRLCAPCRAAWACTNLSDGLTVLLENFLDERWSPHEYGQPHPAYYVVKPNFDGDPAPYLAEIAAAQALIAAGANRLVQLAIDPEMRVGVRTTVEPAYEPHYYGSADYPQEEFAGFHALIDWGCADAEQTEPTNCDRERHEALPDWEVDPDAEAAQQYATLLELAEDSQED